MATTIKYIGNVVTALLYGAIFYNFGNDAQKVYSNITCLFIISFFLFFANAIPAVLLFYTEMALFLQEHLNNWYSLKSYYSVKTLIDFVIQILCSSSFVLLSYYMTGQPMELNRILQVWSVCILTATVGQMIGTLIGVTFNVTKGIFILSIVSVQVSLFSGFYVKINEMSTFLQPLGFVSFCRYSFEGVMQAVYTDRPNLSCQEIYCSLTSNDILSMMNLPTVSFHMTLIILGAWILCLHVLTYAVFCWKIYYAKK